MLFDENDQHQSPPQSPSRIDQPSQESQQTPIDNSQPNETSAEASDEPYSSAHQTEPMEENKDETLTIKKRKPRPKLTYEFFKKSNLHNSDNQNPEDDEVDEDRLWTFFLDNVAQYPIFEPSEDEQKDFMGKHLDSLLSDIRKWSQINFQCGLSLLEFAEKVEKLSVKQTFHDYRHELLKRYISTDWKAESNKRAEERRRVERDFNECPIGEATGRKARVEDDVDDWTEIDQEGKSATVGRSGNKQTDSLRHIGLGHDRREVPTMDPEALEDMRRRKEEILARREAKKNEEAEKAGIKHDHTSSQQKGQTSQSTYLPPPPLSHAQLEEMRRKREAAAKRRLEKRQCQQNGNSSK